MSVEPRRRAWVVSPRRGTGAVQEASIARGPRGDSGPRPRFSTRVTAPWRLQCPKSTPPSWRRCGRRGRGIVARACLTEESAGRVSRERVGGRHPGPREAHVLRGTCAERGSRSVRRVGSGTPPLRARAPTTPGVQRAPRRGTTSACASQSARAPSEKPRASHAESGASFARSSDPCWVIQVCSWRSRRYRGRANLRKQEEPTPGLPRTDLARLAARHRSRKRGRA